MVNEALRDLGKSLKYGMVGKFGSADRLNQYMASSGGAYSDLKSQNQAFGKLWKNDRSLAYAAVDEYLNNPALTESKLSKLAALYNAPIVENSWMNLRLPNGIGTAGTMLWGTPEAKMQLVQDAIRTPERDATEEQKKKIQQGNQNRLDAIYGTANALGVLDMPQMPSLLGSSTGLRNSIRR